MAGTSSVFEWVGVALAGETSLDPMPARGAIRLALREGGLDPATVTATEMKAVLKRLLPVQLRRSGIKDPEGVCMRLMIRLSAQRFDQEQAAPSARAFFERVLDRRR